MKSIKYYALLTILVFSFSSCEDYLTVLPENNQSSGEFWKTKEEVSAVLGAGYVKLRACQEYLFLWGESRGNGIEFQGEGTDGQKDAQKLRKMEILPSNKLADWSSLYKVINMANSVIKFGPGVVSKDESFNVNVMNSYLSEAYFQRSLAYFYLVRIWGSVPFVTEPYVDDDAEYTLAQSAPETIMNDCLEDLNRSLDAAKELFPETSVDNAINTKGRATKWAIYSLIADMNLWLGNYDKCIEACEKVVNSGRVGLISGGAWYSNFFPGNSNESIYEIQYSYPLNQKNDFITWFDSKIYYYAPTYMMDLFEENESDVRGLNGSYDSQSKIWKYIGINGQTKRNGTSQCDQNWIVYRLADIILMEAESYIMKGDFDRGADCIDEIRTRAGITPLNRSDDESRMLTILLDERKREFFCEGKNWFDIVRIASRDNYKHKNILIDQVIMGASASNISMIRTKLADVNSWYMPISQSELDNNSLLRQNSFYENLGN